jgi:predicted Zn finger-like uncharacterized protein
MKIVCESCGAKYSIADEKVAGKVFKIRCKKCSAVIVVKGDQPAEGANSGAFDYGSDAVWHVVVAGEQQGPFAPRQIGELLAEGKIDWEAYVWREGMEGWQPAKDVEDLVKSVMAEAEGGEAQKPAEAAPARGGEVFGGSNDMGADPFAGGGDDGGLSGVIGQGMASATAAGGGADLFADSTRSAFAGAAASDDDDHGARSGLGPKVSGDQAMTGQRNENSVLFSLSNLQALATGSGAAPSGRPKPGMAQGEGSGLIDIRALASATQAVSDKPAAAGQRDKIEDLLAVGSTGTTFSATSLAAPVATDRGDSNKLLLYGMAAAILLLGGVVGFLALRSNSQPVALTPAPSEREREEAEEENLKVPASASAQKEDKPEAPQAAEPAAEEPSADEDKKEEHASARTDKRSTRHEAAPSSAAAKPAKEDKPEPVAAAEPAKKAQSSADKSLDDLLDTALGGKKPAAKPAAAAAASESLQPTPTRDDVLAAMKGVTPAVQACGGSESGVAMTKVGVAGPTGKVATVEVGGQFANSPVGTCVAKEVRKAKFPKFSQPTFSFSYPFKI